MERQTLIGIILSIFLLTACSNNPTADLCKEYDYQYTHGDKCDVIVAYDKTINLYTFDDNKKAKSQYKDEMLNIPNAATVTSMALDNPGDISTIATSEDYFKGLVVKDNTLLKAERNLATPQDIQIYKIIFENLGYPLTDTKANWTDYAFMLYPKNGNRYDVSIGVMEVEKDGSITVDMKPEISSDSFYIVANRVDELTPEKVDAETKFRIIQNVKEKTSSKIYTMDDFRKLY